MIKETIRGRTNLNVLLAEGFTLISGLQAGLIERKNAPMYTCIEKSKIVNALDRTK